MHIYVASVVLRNVDGHLLVVRKRGTTTFMQPGGKPEPGESPEQTALRETHEEVGLTLDAGLLRPLGVFRAAAANEAGHEVEGHVFVHPLTSDPAPAGEIAELRWLAPDASLPHDLAPMLEHHVLPAVRRLGDV